MYSFNGVPKGRFSAANHWDSEIVMMAYSCIYILKLTSFNSNRGMFLRGRSAFIMHGNQIAATANSTKNTHHYTSTGIMWSLSIHTTPISINEEKNKGTWAAAHY